MFSNKNLLKSGKNKQQRQLSVLLFLFNRTLCKQANGTIRTIMCDARRYFSKKLLTHANSLLIQLKHINPFIIQSLAQQRLRTWSPISIPLHSS
jgi:hypothetical protein